MDHYNFNISIIQNNIFLAIQGEAEVGDIAVLISFLHTNSGVHPISCITYLFKCHIYYINLLRCGPLIDLCRGPHVRHTGKIKAMKVTKVT